MNTSTDSPKTLVLIRHAKAVWGSPLQADYDRALAERGEQDAPILGQRLRAKDIFPDLIVASTAKRAAQTAQGVAQGIGYDPGAIQWREEMYHCVASVFEDVLYELDDKLDTVFLVAHNPGISDFAHQLAPGLPAEGMPTCGAVALLIEAAHWSDFARARKTLLLYDTPKKPA